MNTTQPHHAAAALHRRCAARSGAIALAAALLLVVCALLVQPYGARAASEPAPMPKEALHHAGLRAAHPFVANGGQWDARAAFGLPTFAGALFVTRDGELIYSLPAPDAGPDRADRAASARHAPVPGWVLVERFVDAIGRVRMRTPQSGEPAAARVQFVSTATGGSRALDTYETLVMPATFDGIDVTLRARGDNVEKIFTVRPYADPTAIRVRLDGATGVALAADGALVVKTGHGDVTFTAPVAFQYDAIGTRHAVEVAYALDVERATYGFRLGSYDRGRPLVIDPLLKSTYAGASGSNAARAVAVHPATGDVYIAGATTVGTASFPGTTGGAQPSYGGGSGDAYIARYNATLTTLIQATYLGGGADDGIAAIAIHPQNGDIYVTGQTAASPLGFPGVAGGAQPNHGGSVDAFVARLTPSLTTLVRATYVGGTGDEFGQALAIHPATGDVYVGGFTNTTMNFPGAGGGAVGPSTGGDVFVSLLNANLTTLVQSTYFGGSDFDTLAALAIHPRNGDVYIAGQTASTDLPLGAATGRPAAQGMIGGADDGYIARFTPDLATLVRATYLGGAAFDNVGALLLHPASGEVIAVGGTESDVPAFAATAGGARTNLAGQRDAFASRLDESLGVVIQSTYLGTLGFDYATAVALHPVTGEIYVAGMTTGNDASLPGVAGGAQPMPGGGNSDGFISRFSPSLRQLRQSTFVGGAQYDVLNGLAIHPLSGEILVAGGSATNPVTLTGRNTAKASSNNYDSFVARYSLDLRNDGSVPAPFAFAPRIGVVPGSTQISDPVQLSGLSGLAPIAISGGTHAQFCLSSGANCNCAVAPFSADSTAAQNGQYVCVRQQAPLGTGGFNVATVQVGGRAAQFLVTTGNLVSACSLDFDGNGALDALTDGMLLLRTLFGMTGAAVTTGTTGEGATRTTWAQIQSYLNGNCGAHF
jgi:hypothetical protein